MSFYEVFPGSEGAFQSGGLKTLSPRMGEIVVRRNLDRSTRTRFQVLLISFVRYTHDTPIEDEAQVHHSSVGLG
jgi:hypothetical protein